MESKMVSNGIEYVRVGDYYIPNLKLPTRSVPSEDTVGCTVITSGSITQ